MLLVVAFSLLYYTNSPSRAHPTLSSTIYAASWQHSNASSRSFLNIRDATDPSQCACTCPADERSVSDILWSCLAVIFACTWVAVHPDIPKPSETTWGGIRHRFWLMFCALIAPELMVLWAMRQWWGARYLSDALEDYGFTRTHGFFAQMGGFMLWEADSESESPRGRRRIGVLYPNQVWNLVDGRPFTFGNHEINPKDVLFTLPTEEDIQDRSKGDGLAKALVLGQTTWFIAQCISRWAQNLQITELELVTLAFSALNGVVYFLWWDKPLDVNYNVPVVWRRPSAVVACPEGRFGYAKIYGEASSDARFMHFQFNVPQTALHFSSASPKHLITDAALPSDLLATSVLPNTPAYAMHISPLYAYIDIHTEFWALILSSIVAVLFGAIHCAAWNWSFETLAEKTTWRAGGAIITAAPLVVILRTATRAWAERCVTTDNLRRSNARTHMDLDAVHGLRPASVNGGGETEMVDTAQSHQPIDLDVEAMVSKAEAELAEARRLARGRSVTQILLWVIVLLVPLYAVARLALLIEALVALRALTAEMRQQISGKLSIEGLAYTSRPYKTHNLKSLHLPDGIDLIQHENNIGRIILAGQNIARQCSRLESIAAPVVTTRAILAGGAKIKFLRWMSTFYPPQGIPIASDAQRRTKDALGAVQYLQCPNGDSEIYPLMEIAPCLKTLVVLTVGYTRLATVAEVAHDMPSLRAIQFFHEGLLRSEENAAVEWNADQTCLHGILKTHGRLRYVDVEKSAMYPSSEGDGGKYVIECRRFTPSSTSVLGALVIKLGHAIGSEDIRRERWWRHRESLLSDLLLEDTHMNDI
ncbi:hypothetical protein D9619_010138 [Psilocybe cf. subviscida]|uniref:Uncharacterized protein n=1 Tax=Psilocybe cf. subviscida TaxID=2480587 RepID=A0A8H5ASL4_9AGAR|nr:hypothetical protein D9619_010138 [Psilocybe cf. subviscida]